MFGYKGNWGLETHGKTGPEPGGDPVDIFKACSRASFYPQIALRLCITHTWGMWTVSFGSARASLISDGVRFGDARRIQTIPLGRTDRAAGRPGKRRGFLEICSTMGLDEPQN